MKKFFAFVLVMAMTTIASANVANLTWAVDTDAKTLTFSSEVPLSQIDLGEMVIDAGSLTFVSKNDNLGAGSNGFSGADVNGQAGFEMYTPGSIIAFSWAATGATKASGVIATFAFDGATGVTLNPEVNLGSGVGSFAQFADGSVQDLTGTYIPLPEPMTMSLLGLGGLVAARRRRA